MGERHPIHAPSLGPLKPRRVWVQTASDGRAPDAPGGVLGSIAWPEWVGACRRAGKDAEREAARGGWKAEEVERWIEGGKMATWERT